MEKIRVCAVCGISESRLWLKPKNSPGPIVRCMNCGFVFVSPIESMQSLIHAGTVPADGRDPLRESDNLDDLQGRWEEPLIRAYLRELEPKMKNAAEVLGRIEKLHPERGQLFDFGCFCGVFLSVAMARGWEAWGLEPLVGPAIYARGKFGLRVVADTLRDTTFAPEQFDVITAFQVFEHLIDPQVDMQKLVHFLKPGGLLVIEVPNIATPLVSVLRGRHRHFVQDHVSFFSARTLRALMERYGLKARETYYPLRQLSVGHILWWLGHYGFPQQLFVRRLPKDWLKKSLRFGVGDIVTVIGQKP